MSDERTQAIVERVSNGEVPAGFSAHDPGFLKKYVPDILQYGVPVGGAIGAVAGLPFSFIAADNQLRESLKKAYDELRPEIAAHMGIEPEQVSEQLFIQTAMQDPGLAREIEVRCQLHDGHAVEAGGGIMGTGVGAAIGAAAMASTGPIGIAAGTLLASCLGMNIGSAAGRALTGADENLSPMKHLEQIDALRAEWNKTPTKSVPSARLASARKIAAAIFALRVAKDVKLQEAIKGTMDNTSYFDLSAEQQTAVMEKADLLSERCMQEAEMMMDIPQLRSATVAFGGLASSPVVEFAQAGVDEFRRKPSLEDMTRSEIVVPDGFVERELQRRGGQQSRPASMAEMIVRQREAAADSAPSLPH